MSPSEPALKIVASRQFAGFLAQAQTSLAVTTYQAGKLLLIGVGDDGRLSLFERTFNRCMGLGASGRTLWMSSLYQLWRFEDALASGQRHEGYDRIYVPQVAYTTGDIDVHDIAVGGDGSAYFVATLLGCIARPSATHSLDPVWRPPWLSKLAAEDRCHLNGLALRDGEPAFVTAVSRSDVVDGWRDRRVGGGVVASVPSGEVVCDGLSMPHSPRWHDGRLWIAEAGTGNFGWVDLARGRFEPVAFCPGFLRGMTFVGRYAVVGTSSPRGDDAFGGLPLARHLAERDAQPRCGLHIIDLDSGDIVHWLRLEGAITELYDIVALPGCRCPMAIGLRTDEIRRTLSLPD